LFSEKNKTTNSIESKSSEKEDIEDHSSLSSQIAGEYFQQQHQSQPQFHHGNKLDQ